ncbi:MAG: bifunctional glutamate N-acetyltransferase/amino-acid acetyltransferase ArgJ [Phycisphaera sp.]|nr:bifunctional glutamate N-acetyltransferase/amino-acid acetyltransferase ArgJ [Phycisphaera sp.]
MSTTNDRILRSVTAPRGFRAAGGICGIKKSGKPDLALIVADTPCRVAAVFTTNRIPSEPVQLGRRHAASGRCQAIVCNSGCANASTGKRGYDNAVKMCKRVAKHVGCDPRHVIACSTGVIGHQLPMDKVLPGIDTLSAQLGDGARADAAAARAIMTTDLVPKATFRQVKIGGKTVTLGGVCKGSGMIAPNMATMLAFITTDADITLPLLRAALRDAVNADASFNRISVDTDTSPSDTVLLMASGLSDAKPIRKRGPEYARFCDALNEVCRDLAYQIISDGEGVAHVIRVRVERAKTNPDALRIARTVADSPLVKTAVHGGDPNWGRLTAAAGRAGASIRAEKLVVRIGNVTVYRNGRPTNVDLARLERLMKQDEVTITLQLNLGAGSCEFLGCDLGREYITINADYHT